METLIDPMNLTDQHKTLLSYLFKQDENLSIFEAGECYPVTLPRSKGATQPETVKIILTNTIYKRPREKHPKEFRYDILDPGQIEGGQHSSIHRAPGTLKIQDHLFKKNTLQLNTEKKRRLSKVEIFFKTKTINVINPETNEIEEKYITEAISEAFIHKVYSRVYNEMQLANKAGSGHMKQPAILIDYQNNLIRTYTTMRERKGECMFDVLIKSREPKTYTTLQRLDICLSSLLALQKMHALGVIHRDVKAENMFYDAKKNKTKFIDFGYAKSKGMPDKTGRGTQNYIAPELFDGEQSDEKSDLYALGIMISLLWGNKEQDKDDQGRILNHDRDVYYDRDFASLFTGIKTDFTHLEKTTFVAWLNKITEKDHGERASVREAITDLSDFIALYKKNHPSIEKKSEASQKFNFFNKKRTPVNDAKTAAANAPRLSAGGSH
ncbi:MAG TPA: serine/threonine-protein kinase [Gammaproteobacteria bacterium]|nr:serine/threonine-protein kinase [Gammaproteobacteria bacterium]